MLDYLVAGDSIVSLPQRERETCARCCQSLETKMRQKFRGAHIPGVRNNERLIALMKSAEQFSLLFLCLHFGYQELFARSKVSSKVDPGGTAAHWRCNVSIRWRTAVSSTSVNTGAAPRPSFATSSATWTLNSATDKGHAPPARSR